MKSTNMKIKLFCLGVILLILSVITDSQDVRPVREARKRFCGKILKETLGLLCKQGYNALSMKSISSEDDDYYKSLQIPGFPFVPKSDVAQMIAGTNFRRYTRGISEECCYNSCTISELRSYCLP